LLVVSGLGCQPASTTGTASTTAKRTTQPENKDKSAKPPPADPG
jgi:hypothetical protein